MPKPRFTHCRVCGNLLDEDNSMWYHYKTFQYRKSICVQCHEGNKAEREKYKYGTTKPMTPEEFEKSQEF